MEHLAEKRHHQEHLKLRTFEFTEHNSQDLKQEEDPDDHFFYGIDDSCFYDSEEQYDQNIKNNKNKSDQIDTNDMDNKTSGILINDLNDHLPIFTHL